MYVYREEIVVIYKGVINRDILHLADEQSP